LTNPGFPMALTVATEPSTTSRCELINDKRTLSAHGASSSASSMTIVEEIWGLKMWFDACYQSHL